MTDKWFRLYNDIMFSPKVLKLSDKTFRVWVGVLCAFSRNSGVLPPLEDLALLIRMKPEKLKAEINILIESRLLDQDGVILSPHNWDKYQYKSSVSTERVKRFRNAQRNVSETPPDTDTDTDTERKVSCPKPTPSARKAIIYDLAFENFWKTYPDRRNNSKPAAFKEWRKLDEEDQRIATESLAAFSAYCRSLPDYRVVHCERYLRDRRFDEWGQQAAQPVYFKV